MKKILAQAGIVVGATLLGSVAGALGAASVSRRAFKEFEKRAVEQKKLLEEKDEKIEKLKEELNKKEDK